MPTELLDATGDRLRAAGREFGTTTGRPRRCGWFDAPITRHACRTNGVDGLGLMKLDVLDGFERVGLVTGYRTKAGDLLPGLPMDILDWDSVVPETTWYPGWSTPTRGALALEDLPREARVYLDALAESVETPIAYLSTGPDRAEGFAWPGSFLPPYLT
jgi:adenylosuccinate synthase